jgi:Leucine Rich Repeat
MIDESVRPTPYPSQRRVQRYALGLFVTEAGAPVATVFSSSQLPCSPTTPCGNECASASTILKCDAGDTVTELIYSEAGYSSSLPEELGLLTKLTKVNLGGNSIYPGTIPNELNAWTSLTSLNISNAGLTTSIPLVIDSPTNLEVLDLSHNCFSISGDGNSGTIPVAFSSLASLKSLKADSACIGEPFPSVLLAMRLLQELNLGTNGIRYVYENHIVLSSFFLDTAMLNKIDIV